MVTRRGVVLIDVLVGAVLVGLALVALNASVARAITMQRDGTRLEQAAMLADEQLALVLMRGADDYESRYGSSGVCDAPFEEFRYDLRFSGGSGGEAYRVRATILWTSGPRERSLTIETLVAPREQDEAFPERAPVESIEREGEGAAT